MTVRRGSVSKGKTGSKYTGTRASKAVDDKGLDNVSAIMPRRKVPALKAKANVTLDQQSAEATASKPVDDKGLDNASATVPRRKVPALEAKGDLALVEQSATATTSKAIDEGGLDNASAIVPRRKVPALEAKVDLDLVEQSAKATVRRKAREQGVSIAAGDVAVNEGLDNVSTITSRRKVAASETKAKPAPVQQSITSRLQGGTIEAGKATVDRGLDNVSAAMPRRRVPALEATAKPASTARANAKYDESPKFQYDDRVSVFVADEINDKSRSGVRLVTGSWYSGTVTKHREVVEITVGCDDGTYRCGVAPIYAVKGSEEAALARNKTLLSAEIGKAIRIPSEGNESEIKGITVACVRLNDYYVEFDDGDEWWVNEKYNPIRAPNKTESEDKPSSRRKAEKGEGRREVETGQAALLAFSHFGTPNLFFCERTLSVR